MMPKNKQYINLQNTKKQFRLIDGHIEIKQPVIKALVEFFGFLAAIASLIYLFVYSHFDGKLGNKEAQIERLNNRIADDTERINRLSKDSTDLHVLKNKIRSSDTAKINPKEFLKIDSLIQSNKNKGQQIIELKKEIESLKIRTPPNSKHLVIIRFEFPDKKINVPEFKKIKIDFDDKSYIPNDLGIVKLPKTKPTEFTLYFYYKDKKESVLIPAFEYERTIQINY
jgi:hypothetical protein